MEDAKAWTLDLSNEIKASRGCNVESSELKASCLPFFTLHPDIPRHSQMCRCLTRQS